ncbi:hypothetical protein C4D60_Mb08t32090 [Musa balbisiana]|uniref:Uncharacterized protein n=1 Tax=Musa balbisiana TaxID=52838 RepID=A0A4S8K803_MUSBA|nr:hypothetical protein C4D60_Mb08t32090 [Musa balbisiana]
MWMAGDAAMDEWYDDNPALEAGVAAPEESKGVPSEAGRLGIRYTLENECGWGGIVDMWMAGDAAMDEWYDDNPALEAGVAAPEESKGVPSEAGRLAMLALTSCLQTGQNVLQEVSQQSTQNAWNSVQYSTKNVSMEE